MHDDEQALRELNVKIGEAETKGDRGWLATILAPRLAFQRADEQRTIDDHVAFLQKVRPAAPGEERVTRIIEPIEILGNRAVVRCVVRVGQKDFHNLRVFVRREGNWKLLAWANEPM